MKHWLKVVWICVAVLFAAGLAITCIAVGLGARGMLYVNSTGFHVGTDASQPINQSEQNSEPFTDLTLGLVNADLRIVPAETYGYDVRSYSDRSVDVSLHNGHLRITEEPNAGIGINLGFLNGGGQVEVTVYLPKGSSVNTLSIQTISGSASLSVDNLSVASLSYDAVSGSLNANAAALKVTDLSLKTISGKVSIAADVSSSIAVDTISGRAVLDLAGSAQDWYLALDKVSGSVKVNDQRLADDVGDWPIGHWSSGDRDAQKLIDLHLISGSVELNFARR